MRTADQIADYRHDLRKHDWRPGDAMPIDQRLSVSRLIGYCEGLANSGLLGDELETTLRRSIAEVLVAFDMPSQAELQKPNVESIDV